jgi:hypothetical protein
MKNVVLYLKFDDTPYKTHDSILKYLCAQIDNSLHYGHRVEDIIVVTNFEFTYRGVTSTALRQQCDYNVWANKFYVIKQIIEDYHDDVWLHDYDVWQIDNFEFPKFNGMFAGCVYSKQNSNWNGGSFFFTNNSLPILDYLCEYYTINKHILSKMDDGRGPKWFSDEVVLCSIREDTQFEQHCYSLSPQYNLGMSGFEPRYACAEKPIKAIHVKLLDKKERVKYLGLIDNKFLIPQHLNDIIAKYDSQE